jgi:uncharacterized protein YbjT (DUF2867 family)
MAKILVIGATGMLGRPVVVRLFADGFEIRVFTTRLDRARYHFGDNVEYAHGNVGDRESLKLAMQGCDYVYVNLKGGPTAQDYIRVEEEGAKNIYAAAIETRIRKVVQISEARADQRHAGFIPQGVKVRAEQALIASGLTYTVLKPTWFCESLPLMIKANKATYVGSGKTSFHFLAAADYAKVVSLCFQNDRADNKSLIVFGPEAMSILEALRRFLAIAHPDVNINRVPVFLAKFVSLMSTNATLKSLIQLMAFFDRHGDADAAGDPAEAERIFGPCTTTVEEYARMYRQIVKGI